MDLATHRLTLDPGVVRAHLTAGARPSPRLGAAPATAEGATSPRLLGSVGERLAAHHLTADDRLEVVARNWRLRAGELRGELDVVAVDHERCLVVVCEVKTRRDATRFGGAVAAVDATKRARVRVLTSAFLREARLPYRRVRLDLVAIDLGRAARLTHLEGVL